MENQITSESMKLFFGDYKKMFDAPKEYEKVTLKISNE